MNETIKTKQGNSISTTFIPGDRTKKAFVFIHGNAQNETSGKVLIDFFKAKGLPILSYDMPGHGNSEPYPENVDNNSENNENKANDNVNMDTFAETFEEVLEHYNIENAIIAGHSMGGMILLQYATKLAAENIEIFNKKIAGMILIDTSDIDPIKANNKLPLKDIVAQLLEGSEKAFQKRGKHDYGVPAENEDAVMGTGLLETDPKSLRQNFTATDDYDVQGKLTELAGSNSLKMPVLVIRGNNDPLMTEEMTAEMASRLENSKLVSVEGGHNWFLIKPDEMTKVLDENYGMFE